MTLGEAVTALLDTWVEELGNDAAQGLLFGLLIARADPALAEVVERRASKRWQRATWHWRTKQPANSGARR